MASDLIKHISDASFEADVLKADKPVLVDYWAEWCGPCKMIAPILDEVSDDLQGKLQIAKMNVDENRDIPAKFGIRGIPTLMLFKDGQLAATKVGAMSKAQLTAFIDQQLPERVRRRARTGATAPVRFVFSCIISSIADPPLQAASSSSRFAGHLSPRTRTSPRFPDTLPQGVTPCT